MRRARALLLAICAVFCLVILLATPATADDGHYVVRSGDTLSGIARRHNISVQALADANGIKPTAWVYIGQRLVIPETPRPSVAAPAYYVVRRGDTLTAIAARHGTAVAALRAANNVGADGVIYIGQYLKLPLDDESTHTASAVEVTGERWIDVDITNQRLTAYVGQTPVFSTSVSTGIWKYPTVVGTYKIYIKYEAADMAGGYGADSYYLPDVPYVMYFHEGYGLHGTYWHNNFGSPMSHGCVNLSIEDAAWLFNWASVGTRVVTHF